MAEPIPIDANLCELAPAATGASVSLRAAIKYALGSEFPRHAAHFIAADEWRTQSAIDLFVSAILRRLARLSAPPDGAARVLAELDSPRVDSDLAATVARLLADEPGAQGERLDAGEKAAHGLLGRRTGSLVLQIGSTAGIGIDAAWQLLGLTTPLVYAALRDHCRDRGLDAEALRQQLASEYPSARSMRRYPPRRAIGAAARAALASARRDRHALVLGGLVAVAVALLWHSGVRSIDAVARADRGGQIGPVAGGPMPAATRNTGAEGLRAFLSGDASAIEYVFALDGVQFEPGSATLKSSSNAQLAQVAGVLADFPEARLAIEAHADGAASDPVLAENRALAVRAALAAFGIQPSRMSHAGIGGENRPAASIVARVTRG